MNCFKCGGKEYFDNREKKASGEYKENAPDLKCKNCKAALTADGDNWWDRDNETKEILHNFIENSTLSEEEAGEIDDRMEKEQAVADSEANFKEYLSTRIDEIVAELRKIQSLSKVTL